MHDVNVFQVRVGAGMPIFDHHVGHQQTVGRHTNQNGGEFAEGVGFVNRENKPEPVFGVVVDHTKREIYTQK